MNCNEYVRGIEPSALKKLDLDWSEEEKENYVIKAQKDNQNLLQEGIQYILCLELKSNRTMCKTVGSYHGIMRVDGSKVWRKDNTGLFDKEKMLNSIKQANN